MSIPLHGLISLAIMWLFTTNIYLLILAVLLGIFPDIGKFFFGESANSWNGFYRWSHQLKWYLLIIPFWNIHILIDSFWHKPTGGWYKWGYYVEGAIWLVIVLFAASIYYLGFALNMAFH